MYWLHLRLRGDTNIRKEIYVLQVEDSINKTYPANISKAAVVMIAWNVAAHNLFNMIFLQRTEGFCIACHQKRPSQVPEDSCKNELRGEGSWLHWTTHTPSQTVLVRLRGCIFEETRPLCLHQELPGEVGSLPHCGLRCPPVARFGAAPPAHSGCTGWCAHLLDALHYCEPAQPAIQEKYLMQGILIATLHHYGNNAGGG